MAFKLIGSYKHLPTAGDIGRELAEPVGEGEGLTPPAPGPLSLLLQSWKMGNIQIFIAYNEFAVVFDKLKDNFAYSNIRWRRITITRGRSLRPMRRRTRRWNSSLCTTRRWVLL